MMAIVFGVLLITLLLLIMFTSYRRYRDVFSPMFFYALFQLLRYVPGILTKEREMGVSFTTDNLTRFFIIEVIAVLSVRLGFYIHNHYFYHKSIIYVEKNRKPDGRVPHYLIILIYLIGLYGRIRVILAAGGLRYVLGNTREVYLSSGAGSGYTSLLEQLMLVGIIMQIKMISDIPKNLSVNRTKNYILLMIMIALSMMSYLIYSRRSPALELLMFVVFAYHYLIKEIRIADIIKPRVLMLMAAIIAIVVVMPSIRSGNTASLSLFKASSVFDEFSYLGRDVGCYEYFSNHEKWLGKSYINLLMAPIPSALMVNKPPVDDGLYLCNIIHGYEVAPPMPASQLPFYNSYPFSTQGILYANFGIIGVIIGEIIMGAIYGRVYKMLRNTRSDYMVIAFQLVIYQLELSTLSIVQTLIPLLITFFAYKLFKGFKLCKVVDYTYQTRGS